jgi:hypothetical protein
MKKVFLLLRDNTQLGPFTIDELLQQKLSNNDLIWVEGYSLAWSLPSELDLLKLSSLGTAPVTDAKPFTPHANQPNKAENAANPVPIKNKKKRKWAEEDIEGRAEEIRRRTLEYVSSKKTTSSPLITDDDIRSYTRTPDIDFVVHKKTRGVSANFVGAVLVALMLVAGWYGKDKLFIAENNSGISTKAVAPQIIPISSAVQMQPSQNESAAFISEEAEDSIVTEEPQDIQKSYVPPAKPVEKPVVAATETDVNNIKIEDLTKTEKPLVVANEDKKSEVEKKETATVSSKPDSLKRDSSKNKVETKSIEETEVSTEKKKTLGKAIKGIFKKKKKDTDTEDEIEKNND